MSQKVEEFKIKVAQFLTKGTNDPKYQDKKPVPMRIMFGYVTQESKNGVYVNLRGKAEPSSCCFKCGRELTHPVSLLFSIGPECGGHFHESPMPKTDLEAWYEAIKKRMPDITWSGWLPKAYVNMEATGEMIEPFLVEGANEPQPQLAQPTAPVFQPTIQRIPIKFDTPITVDQNLVETLVSELGF